MNDERNERTGSGNLFECYEQTDAIKSTPLVSDDRFQFSSGDWFEQHF